MGTVIKCPKCKKEMDECLCPKFKIGDEVRIVKNVGVFNPFSDKVNLGDVGIVNEITPNAEHPIQAKFGETEELFYVEELELVSQERYKAGDKVRIIKVPAFRHFVNGEIVRIRRVQEDGILCFNKFDEGFVDESEIEMFEVFGNSEPHPMSETQPEPKKAMRFNSGKVEAHTLPLLAIREMYKVGMFGASKYDDNNWRNPATTTQYYNCIDRHALKYLYGQELDSDSKCHHLAHIAWNALAELEKILTGTREDDRYIYPNIDEILDKVCNLTEDQKAAIKREQDKKNEKK